MANKKFTDLGNKSTAAAADILAIVDSTDNASKRTTVAGLAAAIATSFANAAISMLKLDLTTFQASVQASFSNLTNVSAPQTGLAAQTYSFTAGRKYLVQLSISTTLSSNTGSIRDLNLRINGVVMKSQRFQSPAANTQSGGTITYLYTAPTTASYVVDGSMTQAAGSGTFDLEGPSTLVVPLVN